MYEVLLYPDAQATYANADKALAKKIAKCLQQLEQTPLFHPNVKALKGNYAGYYRYRIEDNRVIYSVDEEVVKVFVLTISKRGEAYES
jgi:mRNA interferase RelE/StbE